MRALVYSPWKKGITLAGLGLALALLASCGAEEAAEPAGGEWPEVEGYQAMAIPEDNPMTRAKVELGKRLFYDQRLSGDGSRACYSCHLADKGLTDGRATAVGAYQRPLPRSSPTLWNIGYHAQFYWDGRSGSMEAQVKGAWSGGNMGASGQDDHPSMDDVCAQLDQLDGYRRQFRDVFGEACSPDNVAKAIAAFERTIVSTRENSPWIRFRGGDATALNWAARRGYELFQGKAGCTNCHDGLLLTDLQYHAVGIGWDANKKKFADPGRFRVTKEEKDRGAFKTPTLLDISESAPYFHDGSVATLEEAVDIMLAGGIPIPHPDANLEPRQLSKREKGNLLAFLRALTVDYTITPPVLPQ